MKYLYFVLMVIALLIAIPGAAVQADEPCDTWQALHTYYQGDLAFEQGIEATLHDEWSAANLAWINAKKCVHGEYDH